MGEESSAYQRSPAWRISELERQLAEARDSLRADRAASHVVIEGLRKRAEEAERNFLACAEAVGVFYEADGHARAPGPVDAVVEAIRRQEQRVEHLDGRLTRLLDEQGMGEPGRYHYAVRPLPLIAHTVRECAVSWHRDVMLIGNNRAIEVAYLAEWAYAAYQRLQNALEHVPVFVGEDDPGAAVFGALCCPNGEPGHFWKDGCPSHCWDGVRHFEEGR